MNASISPAARTSSGFEYRTPLDVKDAAKSYETARRTRIPQFLEDVDALSLYRYLAQEMRWRTFVIAEGAMFGSPSAHFGLEGPPDDAAFVGKAHAGAGKGFAALFDASRLFPEDAPAGMSLEQPPDPAPLQEFVALLNDPETLELVREITGNKHICRADAHATRFRNAHFTGFHTGLPHDITRGRRLVAFDLHLTIRWLPEWGGQCTFRESDGKAEMFRPSFNVLDLFGAYLPRWVSAVAPIAEGERLAVSGWFYGPAQ